MDVRRSLRRSLRIPLRLLRRAALPLVRAYVAGGGCRTTVPAGSRPRLTFLVLNAFSQGGTMRTVLEVLRDLDQHYDLEVVSVLKDADRPYFPLPGTVRLRVLDDRTAGPGRGLARWAARLPSVLWHDAEQAYPVLSLWDDVLIARALRALETDVLIGTRHGLTILLGELAPDVVTVAQVHLATVQQHPDVRRAVRRTSGRLDAVAVLTQDEARDHEPWLRGSRTRLVRIPNPVPELGARPSGPRSEVVVAAGRLRPQKGFDLLIAAFGGVVAVRPDWRLRIFGEGSERAHLERLIVEHGLTEHVELRGWTDDMGAELAQASLFALSSRNEGFPMVLLEAMSTGLPVVSFDCPHGPREIVQDGVDGVLVAPGDVAGFTEALLALVQDDERRVAMGEAAQLRARDFTLPRISALWQELYDDLLAERAGGGTLR